MRIKLISSVVNALEDHDFDVLLYKSTVLDIAAQKKNLNLLIKVLENIDGLKQEPAQELKKLALSLASSPILIGKFSKVQKLDSDIIYNRYGISAMSTKCFESCLAEAFPEKKQTKGRHIVEIHGQVLKSGREKKGFTMRQFADKLGVTKEAIYMYETHRIKPRYSTAKQMEEILGNKLIQKQDPFAVPDKQYVKEETDSTLGKKFKEFDFDVYDFHKTKFDTLLKDPKNKVILETNPKDMKQARSFSDFFKTFFAFVTDKTEKDILQTDSKKEFIKLLKEKA